MRLSINVEAPFLHILLRNMILTYSYKNKKEAQNEREMEKIKFYVHEPRSPFPAYTTTEYNPNFFLKMKRGN